MGSVCGRWRALPDEQLLQLTPDDQEIDLVNIGSDECMSHSGQESIGHNAESRFKSSYEDAARITSLPTVSFPCTNGRATNENENEPKPTTLRNWLFNMLKLHFKGIFVIAILIISLLIALNHGSLTTRKAGNPVKFFGSSRSLVTDFEYGQLRLASQLAKQHEITMTMYYAPWDLESRLLKRDFQLVAEHFYGQINFVAINCWWPDGECSKQLSIKRFPVLSAFLERWGDVEYRGPLVASYIIPFLDNLLNPVTTINNEGDLIELRSKHDAVAVGYFDFHESLSPNGYDGFMSAAVRSLTFDPWRKVQYCIVTSRKMAFKLYIDQVSTVTLYFWNSTGRVMRLDRQAEDIVQWVFENANAQSSPLQWLTPSGVKSTALSSILSQGPTMILFTPRSLILGISPFYEMLREAAMDYFNCENSPVIKSLIHRSILRRLAMEEVLMELDEKCHELRDDQESIKIPVASSSESCCFSQPVKWRPPVRSGQKKCFCTACVQYTKSKCPGDCKSFNCLNTASRFLSSFEPTSFVNKSANYCNEIKTKYQPRYTPYYSIDLACTGLEPDDSHSTILSGMNPSLRSVFDSKDDRIARMISKVESDFCSRLQLGLNYSDLNFPESGEGSGHSQSWRKDFTGLACRSNRTLNFVAFDSVLFPSFAEDLGIDIRNETHSTVAVIVEEPQENVYLLRKDTSPESSLSKRALYQFIKNYTENSLPRFMRSHLISLSSDCAKSSVCVPEVSSSSFASVVLRPRKDVILMYYTPWCGFCSSISHVFLSVAHFFRQVDDLGFARINVGLNDLPFEYQVDRVPSIVFYPANKKSSSTLFPPKLPISESNLIEFIVKHSSPSVLKLISSMVCQGKCLQRRLLSKFSHVRTLSRSIKRTLVNTHDAHRQFLMCPKSAMKCKLSKTLGQLTKKLVLMKLELKLNSKILSILITRSKQEPDSQNQDYIAVIQKYLPVDVFEGDSPEISDNFRRREKKRKDEL